jgi:hypothetical protein
MHKVDALYCHAAAGPASCGGWCMPGSCNMIEAHQDLPCVSRDNARRDLSTQLHVTIVRQLIMQQRRATCCWAGTTVFLPSQVGQLSAALSHNRHCRCMMAVRVQQHACRTKADPDKQQVQHAGHWVAPQVAPWSAATALHGS